MHRALIAAGVYHGPNEPCSLPTRNEGTLTGLPTCCLYHRKEATQARIAANGCPCNPARPYRSCPLPHGRYLPRTSHTG